MKISKILLLLFAGFLFTHSAIAQSSSEIRSMMNERDKEIKALVGPEGTTHTDEQKEKLKDIINGIIDYGAMAKIALESTFDTISDEQRTEFIDLFGTIIRNQSLNKLDIYRASVEYNQIDIDNNTALVKTTATLDNIRTPVSYSMEKRDNTWYITDMSIDNVSTAESYRRSFQNVIRRRGFDALLESLRKRAAN